MLKFLKRSKQTNPVELPAILQPENPINYNSVLDYLVGLSKTDFAKMVKSAEIYREANAKVSKITGIPDEPTSQLIEPKQTDEEIDSDLDQLLETDPKDLVAAIVAAPEKPKPTKQQAAKKIDVKD